MQNAPRPPSPTEPLRAGLVPPLVLHDLLAVGRALGLDTARWLRRTGLDARSLELGGPGVAWSDGIALVGEAVRDARHVPLGLRVAKRESLSSYGLLGFAILSAPTLRDALEVGIRHHRLAGSLTDPDVELTADEVRIRLAMRPGTPTAVVPFLCEEMFGGMLVCLRSLLGAEFAPMRAAFPYSEPRHATEYAEVFRCPLRFGSARCSMAFPRAWLDRPLQTGNAISFAHAVELCERVGAPRHDGEDALRGVIGRLIGLDLSSPPALAEIGRRLGLSPRTIRRRLEDEGTSYRELVRTARLAEADRLLRAGLGIRDVSDRLGFSEPREFRRAFKRALGVPPSRLRAASRDPASRRR
jgi:AraC-like DNA-binding protein